MNIQDVLIKPVLTEHSLAATTNNQYTFVVNRQATKPQIRKAIQELFGVEVQSVHTVVMKGGKRKIVGRKMVITHDANWKKAFVQVKAGKTIDLFDFSGTAKDEDKKKKTEKKESKKAEKPSEIKAVKRDETQEEKKPEKKSSLRSRLLGSKEGKE